MIEGPEEAVDADFPECELAASDEEDEEFVAVEASDDEEECWSDERLLGAANLLKEADCPDCPEVDDIMERALNGQL